MLFSDEGGLVDFGRNTEGQLGLGHANEVIEPEKIPWGEAGESRSCQSPFTSFQRVMELPLFFWWGFGCTEAPKGSG